MSNDVKISRVSLDGVHSLDISVNDKAKTVVAELVFGDESTFIYAEKFDAPCNYLRTAIKKSILYLNGGPSEEKPVSEKEKGKNCICLNTERYVI